MSTANAILIGWVLVLVSGLLVYFMGKVHQYRDHVRHLEDRVAYLLAKPDRALNVFQAEVYRWAYRTFPGGTLQGAFRHLHEELEEILEAPEDITEWADAFIILLHRAAHQGHQATDILAACREKHEVNKGRTWSAENPQGYRKHVESSP